MIFTSSSPLSPSVEISVLGTNFDYIGIKRLTLELGEDKHDSLRIMVSGITSKNITDYVGSPVRIKWVHNDDRYMFVGYVTHVEPDYEALSGFVKGNPVQLSTIYCLGASFDMKPKRNGVWDNVTLGSIVSKIAARYRYSADIPKDGFIFHRLVQSGESDWEFLRRIAHQLGYSVTVHGTHIHIFDRYKAHGRLTSYNKLLVPVRKSLKTEPGQIIEFKGSFGYVTPNSNVNQERMAVLDNRGQTFYVESGVQGSRMGPVLPFKFKDELASTSLSPEYAKRKLRQRSRDKYPFQATIVTSGISGILPGGIVDVQDFDSRFDGLWYVKDVTQVMTHDKYYTEITAIKDAYKGKSRRSSPMKVRSAPRPVLRGKQWQAASQKVSVYG